MSYLHTFYFCQSIYCLTVLYLRTILPCQAIYFLIFVLDVFFSWSRTLLLLRRIWNISDLELWHGIPSHRQMSLGILKGYLYCRMYHRHEKIFAKPQWVFLLCVLLMVDSNYCFHWLTVNKEWFFDLLG